MKRQTRKDLNEICDLITALIDRTSSKDLFDVGYELCVTTALAVTDGMEGNSTIDTFLLPSKFVGDVKDVLIEAIDRVILDELGEMCVAESKKDKEVTAS
jgi:hypothetical protein